MKRYKDWRLDRAKIELADAEYEYDKVKLFDRRIGVLPSEKLHAERRVEKAAHRVEKLVS